MNCISRIRPQQHHTKDTRQSQCRTQSKDEFQDNRYQSSLQHKCLNVSARRGQRHPDADLLRLRDAAYDMTPYTPAPDIKSARQPVMASKPKINWRFATESAIRDRIEALSRTG